MENKIYVLCPANYQTGGTELAHQLVDYLNKKGLQCYIVYYSKDKIVNEEIPEGFRKYKIKTSVDIEDNDKNYLFIPESSLYFARQTKNIKLFFWWMSFDNFFGIASIFDYLKYFFKGYFTWKQLLIKIYFYNIKLCTSISSLRKCYKDRLINVYQSKYAQHEIFNLGFYNQLPLSDYINKEFIQDYLAGNSNLVKQNIVLYNPAKGIRTTRRLIKSAPEIKFVPLSGLTRVQMKELLRTAKVYIDFGNHPGKDRIPREACINGCCVIVAAKGSAKYFEDVPISENYKFSRIDIKKIKNTINNIFDNYEQHNKDFVYYRSRIVEEESIFYKEIDNIIEYINLKNIKSSH
ncbi:hypothetical protein [Cloacibacterium sp. TD35]|uniref:hypothetical protein n=1 Tax=Cloacibacterium sp. TD35 TaxID=2976818 RepID=UPI00237D8A03|nr:hypothetical protein [Cloacibacterium sp. TD35]WDT68102.1 hypothetical protein N7277_00425 [Cloacibacterium sp. TD35]